MWSKLITTPVGYHAENIMRRNNRAYHNWQHILDMFEYLELTNYPYSVELDAAILFHDSVYDDKPNKEIRSGELFLDYAEMYPNYYNNILTNKVFLLIHDTIEHKIYKNSSPDTSAIIRADLHGLTKGETTLMNFIRIMNESKELYGIDSKTHAENTMNFMSGLYERCKHNKLHDDVQYNMFWESVNRGIAETQHLCSILIR